MSDDLEALAADACICGFPRQHNGPEQCLGGSSRRMQPEGFQRYVLAMVRHPLGISYLVGRLAPCRSLLDGAAPNTVNLTAASWLCLTTHHDRGSRTFYMVVIR